MKKENLADKARGDKEILLEFEEDLFFMAHELQAPLRKISGFAGLLAQGTGMDPKTLSYAARIQTGAERMSGLITALFRYSRAIAQPTEPAGVDIGGVVEGVLKDLAQDIRQAGGVVRNEAGGRAETDPHKLAAILRELVSNALKFQSGKRPSIYISAKRAGKELVVSVSDNGIGVTPAGKLFTLFRRLHSEKEFPGAGVGLALCRRLAEQCGGRVWFKSKPGKGAVFCLALPVRGKKL